MTLLDNGTDENLYLVQDADRPLYVAARDWAAAIDAWRMIVNEENGDDPDHYASPDGVQMIASSGEWFSRGSREVESDWIQMNALASELAERVISLTWEQGEELFKDRLSDAENLARTYLLH